MPTPDETDGTVALPSDSAAWYLSEAQQHYKAADVLASSQTPEAHHDRIVRRLLAAQAAAHLAAAVDTRQIVAELNYLGFHGFPTRPSTN